ncbi:hypothetical protein GEV33_007422 [Tenebrio molitor]|uniref:Uncharacterized protein n=1 Tax=Tenebrio molitor TaxID=7067 RepID=A0A8J6HIK8_TENMO|nr:hypothetical protein GEV33_007422 [Tenebrio molitor]
MRGKKPFMFQSRDTGSVDSTPEEINFVELCCPFEFGKMEKIRISARFPFS